jgi:hypothetical protein
VSIPVRNNIAWRALWIAPYRILREGKALIRDAIPFHYKRLEPNLEKYVYTDCDAFTSMDPHAAILYFKTRGFDILSHLDVLARLTARHEPVVIRKPSV